MLNFADEINASYMHLVRKFSIVVLFLMGLVYSPSFSYEKKISATLKFESGLNIAKDNISDFCKSKIVNRTKKSKSDLDLIFSEHRFVFYKLSTPVNYQEAYYTLENCFTHLNYFQKNWHLSYFAKDIYQLQVLLI